jgi:hypothetical protein
MPTKLAGTKYTLSDDFRVASSVVSVASPVSVRAFGAKGDGVTDDTEAIQAAINALPAVGGSITIGPGAYVLEAEPLVGAKSIYWDISVGASFSGLGTGVGKFPYMETNTAQMAVGPYIRSQSSQKSAHANGGIAALNVEMLQPATYGAGQSVAAYFGASGSDATATANVWALNTLIRADAGAGGTYQCIEVDVDVFSAGALTKGISISGAGSQNPDVALEVVRLAGTWDRGVDIYNSAIGVKVRNTANLTCGLSIGAPSDETGVAISVQQIANGDDMLLLQRRTDSAPTGNVFRYVNAANNTVLASIDINGNANWGTVGSTSDAAVGADQITVQNASVASNTTKYAGLALAGRDTVNSAKTAGYVRAYPGDSNWTAGDLVFGVRRSDALAESMRLKGNGDIVLGAAQIADAATAGFVWFPTTTAGAPSGTPAGSYSGMAPIVIDDTNSRIYVRIGSTWKYVELT